MTSAGFTPSELKQRLDRGEAFVLLDVREADEFDFCRIAGSVNLPLGELAAGAARLDPDSPTVCICHHGVRSAHAVLALRRRGFREVHNLRGGVERWAREVDPEMARY